MVNYETTFIDKLVPVVVFDNWSTIIVSDPDRFGRIVGYIICSELEQELSFERSTLTVRIVPSQTQFEIRIESEPSILLTKHRTFNPLERIVQRALSCAQKLIDHPTR